MAGVRDPAFWRRFSMAVHMDEEANANTKERPGLKHSESWLDRQQHKKSRRTCICWIFWLAFAAIAAGVVIVILWLKSSGVLDKIGSGSSDEASATSTAAATTTATRSITSATAAATSALAVKARQALAHM